jgi:tRNA A-37 threonylcarbamoyl transferase component Bud32
MASAMNIMTKSSYKTISEGEMKGWMKEELLHLLPAGFFDDPVSAIKKMEGAVLRESRLRWAAIFCLPNQQRIFLKRDRTKGWFESLKYLILPSKARKEWFIAHQLQKRNLAIPRPLGWMEKVHRRTVQESYYLSEAIGSGVSFIEDCSKSGDPFLVGELANAVKKIHKAGLFHGDLHAGNFLWDGKSFFLVDLHSAKITSGLSLSQKLWNLAHLFHSLRSEWGEKEHSKFIEVYVEGESFDSRKKERILQKVHSWMDRLQKKQWRSRTKRCLKESSEFSVQKGRGVFCYRRRDFPLEVLRKKIEEHLRLVEEKPSDLVKCSPDITVSILLNGGRRLCVKQYRPRKYWRSFKEHFRRSKGFKAWVGGNGLSVRGISSLKPLGLVERRNWSGLSESSFLREVSDRDQELDRYILANLGDFKERRSFIKAFAKWLSHYHQLNLYHQDMKTCNMVISKVGEAWNFHLLDLEDVRLDEKVGEKEVFRSLLQLNTSTPKMVTTTDRLRFFVAYLRLNPIVRDPKSFLRRLINESKRRELVYVSPAGVVMEKL